MSWPAQQVLVEERRDVGTLGCGTALGVPGADELLAGLRRDVQVSSRAGTIV